MADPDGKLSEDEKQLFAKWLVSQGIPPPVCPLCGSREWAIADHLVQPLTLGGAQRSIQLSGIGYPQVMLISAKCGHTLFVNAVVAGLLPQHKVQSAIPTPESPASPIISTRGTATDG
jgi:hypothetical protein